MRYRTIFSLILLFFIPAIICGQTLKVSARVSSRQVYAGEPLTLQVVVEGSDQARDIDTSSIMDFKVNFQGSSPSNSQSITLINGKMTKVVSKSIIFHYQLIPLKTGRFSIPALMVHVNDQNFMTEPIGITVEKPVESTKFKVRQTLSRTNCYVGQPITFTVTWYIQMDVDSPRFNIPLFSDSRFKREDLVTAQKKDKKYFSLTIDQEQITLEQGTARYQGVDYTTLSFEKKIFPKVSGALQIDAISLYFRGAARTRQVQDFFGQTYEEPVYEKFTIASNALQLNVMPLPDQGKPPHFSGLLGQYDLQVTASPREVKVGDPITLTLTLKGQGNLKEARLPLLHEMRPLNDHFKVAEEMASGQVRGQTKVFTQTIRALHDQVNFIPPLQIAYFDPEKEKYQILKSARIPIQVNPTRQLTIADVEGIEQPDLKSEIEDWKAGIAYNYEGLDVLKNQAYRADHYFFQPFYIMLLALPLVIYLALLIMINARSGLAKSPAQARAKKVYQRLSKNLSSITDNKAAKNRQDIYNDLKDIFTDFTSYLGHQLNVKGSAVTFNDLLPLFQQYQVAAPVRDEIRQVFAESEAFLYASQSLEKEKIIQICCKIRLILGELEKIT